MPIDIVYSHIKETENLQCLKKLFEGNQKLLFWPYLGFTHANYILGLGET